MQLAYLSLGANIGDREATLRGALERLARLPDSQFVAASSLYETSPVGFETKHAFINCAACILTHLPPPVLLDHCRVIEAEMGRERAEESWGVHDRTLDIDIIAYGNLVLATPTLTLPHPRATQRLFVLLPLCELHCDLALEGKTVREWANEVADKDLQQTVRKLG